MFNRLLNAWVNASALSFAELRASSILFKELFGNDPGERFQFIYFFDFFYLRIIGWDEGAREAQDIGLLRRLMVTETTGFNCLTKFFPHLPKMAG
jgi:hypothetical protein